MAEAAKKKQEDNLVATQDLLQLLHTARRKLSTAGYQNESMKNRADTVQSILALIFGAPAARLTQIQLETVRALEKELRE